VESRSRLERAIASRSQIDAAIASLPGWELSEGKLCKEFRFDSFADAIGWMVSVAIFADKLDHHPEWCNVYGRVSARLVTHDLGSVISTLDLQLAKRMEELAHGK